MVENLGKTIKRLRKKCGLTQLQLASQLGVSKSVVSYYELSERAPSPEVLVKLATIFHVSTDYLLGISEYPTVNVSGLSNKDIQIIEELIQSLKEKSDKKN